MNLDPFVVPFLGDAVRPDGDFLFDPGKIGPPPAADTGPFAEGATCEVWRYLFDPPLPPDQRADVRVVPCPSGGHWAYDGGPARAWGSTPWEAVCKLCAHRLPPRCVGLIPPGPPHPALRELQRLRAYVQGEGAPPEALWFVKNHPWWLVAVGGCPYLVRFVRGPNGEAQLEIDTRDPEPVDAAFARLRGGVWYRLTRSGRLAPPDEGTADG